jgi:hypothetical protein
MPVGERPHPRRALRRGDNLHDAADNLALGEHVVVVLAPMAGRARGIGAFEDEF